MKRRYLMVFLATAGFGGAVGQAQSPPSAPTVLSTRTAEGVENGLIPRIILEGEAGRAYNLLDRMKKFNVPGVSAALFNDHEIVWARGFGSANSARYAPVDRHTRFQAASISKSVTAFAVLRLVEDKHLDLDRDVNDYLKSWKVPDSPLMQAEKVTIRRLLSHTAGLNVGGFAGYDMSDTIPDAVGVLDGKGNSPALRIDAVPGTKYSYSGGGYVVLQKLIEDQTGMAFGQYLQTRVLTPVGMRDSSFDPEPKRKMSLAHGFDGKPLHGGWHRYPELAPAGLWTTPSDIAKFSFAVLKALAGTSGALISQPLAQQMLAPSGKPDGGNGYGLGFELRGSGMNASFGHGGSNAGFKSELLFFPKRGIGMVLMTNSENGRVVRNELARSISNRFGLGIFPSRVVKPISISQDQRRAVLGVYHYAGEDGYDLSAEPNGDSGIALKNLKSGQINHLIFIERDKLIDRDTGLAVDLLREGLDEKISGILYDGDDRLTKFAS
jgi:CubicO group peptidase (beta-lactamase class C family)